MTTGPSASSDRRSRWLPTTIAAAFALVLLVDVTLVVVGAGRPVMETSVEVVFTPAAGSAGGPSLGGDSVAPGSPALAADEPALAEASGSGFVVSEPGELTFRFRSPHAGSDVVLDYDFGRRRPGARCEVTLARVPSRHGIDVISRRTLSGSAPIRGAYRHSLADHVGWFELSLRLNRDAVEGGFRVGRPRIERG